METLKVFLIKRLIAVMAVVLVSEALVLALVRVFLVPIALRAASMQPPARVSVTEILLGLYSVIIGHWQLTPAGIAVRSGAVLLMLLSLFLLAAPVTAGIILYAQMVSARVDELQRKRDEEHREYDAQRSLMLSDFAHDLRTPIMTISGYAGALQDGMVKDEEQKKEYLDAIRRKADRMSELINLLFDYVRLGSASFALNREDCDINRLAAETAAALYTDIEQAGMELEAEIPEEAFIAEADKAQAGRILNNLLVNAVRHNPPGTRIALRIRRLAGMEVIEVADSGVPIPGDPEKLFEPFVKGDGSRSGDRGSGLGLSIARKITEMHGWTLTLEQPCSGYTKAFVLRVQEKSD